MVNMHALMQKAQAMQKKMEDLQNQLGNMEVTGAAGGGLVTATVTCKGQVKALSIDPSLINPSEKEVLEDIIKAALNDARAKADTKMADETQKAMGDMGLPAGMLGGGGLPF